MKTNVNMCSSRNQLFPWKHILIFSWKFSEPSEREKIQSDRFNFSVAKQNQDFFFGLRSGSSFWKSSLLQEQTQVQDVETQLYYNGLWVGFKTSRLHSF